MSKIPRQDGITYQRHGLSKTRAYKVWHSMMNRCYNLNAQAYSDYGERGIRVNPRWHNPVNFCDDIGDIPVGMQIDRIDNNKNYGRNNVRLSTPRENQQNTRVSLRWYVKGRVFESGYEAAEYFGVHVNTIGIWCGQQKTHGQFRQLEDCWAEKKYGELV